jgi:hypothetical protein
MTTDEKNPNTQISAITVDEVGTAHARWWDALVAADVPMLDTLLADDLTFHSPFGTVAPKTGILENLRSGRIKYDTIKDVDPVIRLHGQTAILTGRADIHYQWESQPMFERLIYTAVYGWTASHWRMLAYQSTPRADA